MGRRASFAFVAATLCLACGLISTAQGVERPALIGQGFFVRQHYADFHAILSVERRHATGRARVAASLHGLPPGEYELAGVTKPCSTDLDAAGVEAATVFELKADVTGSGEAFVATGVELVRSLRKVRSVRVYQTTPDEGFVQRDCTRSIIGSIAGGGKGAAIGAARRPAPKLVESFITPNENHNAIGAILGGGLGTGARVHAFASLHGLTPNTTVDVAGVTKPCSVDLDAAGVEAAEVFDLSVPVGAGGDAFVTRPIARTGAFRRIRSLRVYEKEQDAEVRQLACKSAVFIGGGAATGALIGR